MTISLLLDLKVNKLLPSPKGASVAIGIFRTSCDGNNVRDESFTMSPGDSITSTSACGFSTCVLRTTRQLRVFVMHSDGTVLSISTLSLLVITQPYSSLVVSYPIGTDAATVSLIQS